MRTFGSVLRQLAAERELMPAEIAKMTGLKVQTISAMLKRNNRTTEFIPRFADAFGVSSDRIYAMMQEDEPSSAPMHTAFVAPHIAAREPLPCWDQHNGDVQQCLDTIGAMLQALPTATRTVVIQLLDQWAHNPSGKRDLVPAIALLLRTAVPDEHVARHIEPAPTVSRE